MTIKEPFGLSNAFMQSLTKAWVEHGDDALLELRKLSPYHFVKLVISVLPKETIIRAERSYVVADAVTLDELETECAQAPRRRETVATLQNAASYRVAKPPPSS